MTTPQRYAFFDVDQTLYFGYSTSEFIVFLAEHGVITKTLIDQYQKMDEDYTAGYITYRDMGVRVLTLFGKSLKGKKEEDIAQWQKAFMESKERLFPYVTELFSFLKAEGFSTYLISTAPQIIVEAIGKHIGTTKCFGSELEIKEGKYTGEVLHLLNFEEKKHVVHRIMGHLSEKSLKVAFGDSTGDVEMLQSADQAFLINPHQQEMYDMARSRGWVITQDAKVMIEEIKKLMQKIKAP
jgi:HAD superfamily hydrolase (TIGR01490 family)